MLMRCLNKAVQRNTEGVTITTCRSLLLVNYYDLAFVPCKIMLAFGPLNSPPLESNTEKEDISSTREGQTL